MKIILSSNCLFGYPTEWRPLYRMSTQYSCCRHSICFSICSRPRWCCGTFISGCPARSFTSWPVKFQDPMDCLSLETRQISCKMPIVSDCEYINIVFINNFNVIFIISIAIFYKIYEKSFEFERNTPIKMWIGPRLLIFLTDPRDVEV